MRKDTPEQLALDVMRRSTCQVQVGAAIYDKDGIFSWGWNHDRGGYGMCAEQHAIQRANPGRLFGATIVVVGQWRKSNNPVPAKPCDVCQRWLDNFGMTVRWRDKEGVYQ